MWWWDVPLTDAVELVTNKYPKVNGMVRPFAAPTTTYPCSLREYWANFIVDICRIKCKEDTPKVEGDTLFVIKRFLEVGKGNGGAISFKKDGAHVGNYYDVTVSRAELFKLHIFVTWMVWDITNTTGPWYWRLIPMQPNKNWWSHHWFPRNRAAFPQFVRVLKTISYNEVAGDIANKYDIVFVRKSRSIDAVSRHWLEQQAQQKAADLGVQELNVYHWTSQESVIPEIPKEEIPAGMSYEWKVVDVFGRKINAKKALPKPDITKGGWKFVPASRHPWLECDGDKIIVSGMALMERPQKRTDAARAREYEIARRQLNTALDLAKKDEGGEFKKKTKAANSKICGNNLFGIT